MNIHSDYSRKNICSLGSAWGRTICPRVHSWGSKIRALGRSLGRSVRSWRDKMCSLVRFFSFRVRSLWNALGEYSLAGRDSLRHSVVVYRRAIVSCRVVCVGVLVCGAMTGYSQTYESLPYEFGFEDDEAAELAKWTLNPGMGVYDTDSLIDSWCVGEALHSSGDKGLYMSNTGGLTSDCGKRYVFINQLTGAVELVIGNPKYVQFAYRDFVLPTGKYYVGFDYISPNMQLAAGYVTFIQPPTAQSNKVTLQRGTDALPAVNTVIGPNSGVETWTTANFTLNVTQPSNGEVRYVRLWFVWINSEEDSVQTGISGAIDNIQIVENRYPIPTDFVGVVENCDHVVFSWNPVATRYQFQYRRIGDKVWKNRWVNNSNTYTLQNMKEGSYDFRVRSMDIQTDAQGRADTIYSPYAYISNFNVFCPELHCINYSNLTDTTLARCTYGTTSVDGYEANKDKAFERKGVVDQGPNSILSRHTVIWDTLATDPRTNGLLRMVPRGETSSVRLGNWASDNGTEAITYPYYVDDNSSILLLRYAIVLEDPDGHKEDEMPRFVLEVHDENGDLVDASCGRVDLNPLSPDGGWKTIKKRGLGETDIVYKDWTTIGLNLSAYTGRTLQISVATYDCFLSAHYGYAYFTMDCESANIKNTGCGKDVMEVVAPDGFNYEWRTDDGTVRSTERTVDIRSTDPTNWTCRLSSKENMGCWFELSINTMARWPQAEFSIEYTPQNCENRYTIKNSSYVWVSEDGKRIEYRDESCEDYEWEFSTGEQDYTTDPNPGYVIFPSEGGKHWVHLVAKNGIGEGACMSDTTIEVMVPRVGDTMERVDTAICEGSWLDWHGTRYTEAGQYTFQGEDPVTGCYANDTLSLTIHPQDLTELPDTTVCYGDTVWLDSLWCDVSRTLRLVVPNRYGCDSTVMRKVTVLPELMPIVEAQEADSAHRYGYIHVTISDYSNVSRFTINDTEYSESVELDSLRGGIYHLTFYNDFGCSMSQEIKMCRYLIFQSWNDVISLMNANYEGGGVFAAYQWYENDEPIAGANKSYYYKPGGFVSEDDYYTCLVTLPDGAQEMSCIFVPTITHEGQSTTVTPNYIQSGQSVNITVPEKAMVRCYNALGQPILNRQIEAGSNMVQLSADRGVYVLIVSLPEGDRPFRIVVE